VNQAIENRTVIPYGLSIGTGLALETMFEFKERFDPDRKIPDSVKPETFKVHVFNVYTLFRNVINSIKYPNKDMLIKHKDVHTALVNDVYLIKTLYEDKKLNPILYFPNYTKLYAKYNKGKKGSPTNTYLQYTYMRSFIAKLGFPLPVYTDTLFHATSDVTLLMSNVGLDLFNIKRVKNLKLLESHTGKIKDPTEWYTKYHPIGKRDLSAFPFNPYMLYMLGDKTLVKAMDIVTRKNFYEYCIVKGITQTTSEQQIRRLVKNFYNDVPELTL